MIVKAENGLVRILKKEGIDWVSTYPTTVINNACGEEEVKNLMLRTDRLAVSVADGFSRCSDGKRFGVCSVQGGMNAVGAHLAYGAIVHAFEDSTPMLCVTDGISPDIMGTTRTDLTQMFGGVTKWTAYVNKPHRVSEVMTRAFTYLKSGRPGPVLVQLPQKLGEFDENDYPYEPVKGWKQEGDPRDVEVAVRALLGSERPVIYAGQGVFYADACEELIAFAELVQAPVLTSLKGKSAFPENHPLSLGVTGSTVENFLQTSDLIFAIGCGLSPGRRYGGFKHQILGTRRSDLNLRSGKTIVQCNVDPMDINRYYRVDHAVIGDAKLVLNQLISEASKQASSRSGAEKQQLIAQIASNKSEQRQKYQRLMDSNERPINPYRICRDLMEVIDRRNSCITHESGSIREQLTLVYESLIPHGFVGWGTVTPLGFGLGAAIGAKLAFPGRQVVSVTGDAGISYQIGDFEPLLRNNIAITTIHFNNSGFSGYGPGPWGAGTAPFTSEVTSSKIENYAAMVDAMGIPSERVDNPDEVASAIKRALNQNSAGRPAFVEIICGKEPLRGWIP